MADPTREAGPSAPGADLIVTRGKVVTVDRRFAIAEAVAAKGERIIAVGGAAEVGALAGPSTKIIDAKGRAVIPGLIDAHAHLDREGLKSVFPSLAGCRSIADVQARIHDLTRKARPGEWIVTMPIGEPPYYFDVAKGLKEGRFPTRRELDEAAPDNPVYIRPIWGYWRHIMPLTSVANSRALALAGIGRTTEPPSKTITLERDASGEPNGIIHEDTYMPIAELTWFAAAPRFTHDDRVRGLKDAMRVYNATGTTSVFEEHGAAQELIRAYQAVNAAGEATVRASLIYSPSWTGLGAIDYDAALARWSGWLGGRGLGDQWLRVFGVYAEEGPALDQTLRARASPYTGWSGFNYDSGVPRERLKDYLIACARNGIRVVTITLDYLDLYEEVDRVVPIGDLRWIISHLDVVTEDQARRIARLGVVMSTHTNRYIYKVSHLLREELGPARESDICPMQRLKAAGVHVGLATDNVPTTLFYPIWHVVARENLHTKTRIAVDQALSREDALRAATIEGAWLTFEEDEKGSLEAGKLADIAVLSADPLTCPEDAIKDIAAETTIVGGKVVYQRSAA
jgi:predicted amidohydrolase YtcJ